MTESNIDHFINSAAMVAMMIYIYFMFRGGNRDNKSETNTPNTPKAKSIWDKIEILSKIIAAIGALIYAVVKLIEFFFNPIKIIRLSRSKRIV